MEQEHHDIIHDLIKILVGLTPISGFIDLCKFIRKYYINHIPSLFKAKPEINMSNNTTYSDHLGQKIERVKEVKS